MLIESQSKESSDISTKLFIFTPSVNSLVHSSYIKLFTFYALFMRQICLINKIVVIIHRKQLNSEQLFQTRFVNRIIWLIENEYENDPTQNNNMFNNRISLHYTREKNSHV